jgi:serine protease
MRPSLLLAAALAAASCLVPLAWSQPARAMAHARVIVQFREGSPTVAKFAPASRGPQMRADDLGRRLRMPLRAGAALSDRSQVVFADGVDSAALAAQVARDADVEYAVADERRHAFVAPNDPLYGPGVGGAGPAVGQWYLRAPDDVVKSSLDIERAWAVTSGAPGIVVAVLDTGVRFDHPDLGRVDAGGPLLPGYDMVSDAAPANDGDGRDADASDPGDWVTVQEANDSGSPFHGCTTLDTSTGQSVAEDSSWHGTQTAGIIGARTGNGIGMASVARSVRVLPVRVLAKCGGYDSDIIAGMRWAAGLAVPGTPSNASPARVISMSLGGKGTCTAAYQAAVDAVTAAGAVVVAAAGNDAGHSVSVPANCRGVLAVGALRHVGSKVGFSNVGPEVAISAPGGNCINVDAGSPCLYPILTTTNTGTTTPLDATYSDSYRISVGTSFATPLVAGTVALMLSAQPALTPSQVRALLTSTARPFPLLPNDADGAPMQQCQLPQYDTQGKPVDQLECQCTTSTCGAGMLDAGSAVQLAKASGAASTFEAEGLWWNAPGGSESGWGLNVVQQDDVIFATWFTYDTSGKAWWLSMTGSRTAANTYSGTLYQTRGPAFDAATFDPAAVTSAPVGVATLTLTDANDGTFSYTVNGIAQSKTVTRQAFGPLPTCTFGTQPNLALATNYQDLWWAAPAGSQSGWGLNVVQQGSTIFATWFTYDHDGSPLWLSMSATASGTSFTGTLYRTSGPAFNAVRFDPSTVVRTPVGSATLAFANGNAGTFRYTVNGASGQKAITRQVFRAPGTVCQ